MCSSDLVRIAFSLFLAPLCLNGPLSPAHYDHLSQTPLESIAYKLRAIEWREGDESFLLLFVNPPSTSSLTEIDSTNITSVDGLPPGLVVVETSQCYPCC